MANAIPKLKNRKVTTIREAAPGQRKTINISGTDSRGRATSININPGKGSGVNSATGGAG